MDSQTPKKFALEHGVTPQTVYNWLHEGRIPGKKIGGIWQLNPEQIDLFLQQNGCSALQLTKIPNNPTASGYYGIATAAALLDVPRRCLWQAARTGQIPVKFIKRLYFIAPSVVRVLIESKPNFPFLHKKGK